MQKASRSVSRYLVRLWSSLCDPGDAITLPDTRPGRQGRLGDCAVPRPSSRSGRDVTQNQVLSLTHRY